MISSTLFCAFIWAERLSLETLRGQEMLLKSEKDVFNKGIKTCQSYCCTNKRAVQKKKIHYTHTRSTENPDAFNFNLEQKNNVIILLFTNPVVDIFYDQLALMAKFCIVRLHSLQLCLQCVHLQYTVKYLLLIPPGVKL